MRICLILFICLFTQALRAQRPISDIYGVEYMALAANLLEGIAEMGKANDCNAKFYNDVSHLSNCQKITSLAYGERYKKPLFKNECEELNRTLVRYVCENKYKHVLIQVHGSQCNPKFIEAIAYSCETSNEAGR
ncbi:MAG: hypothetical protein JNM93_13075 [Bacteriovoracaceae bacterium]|nr:hypothetical protein [Bacteriovoracaceae bacterium]